MSKSRRTGGIADTALSRYFAASAEGVVAESVTAEGVLPERRGCLEAYLLLKPFHLLFSF